MTISEAALFYGMEPIPCIAYRGRLSDFGKVYWIKTNRFRELSLIDKAIIFRGEKSLKVYFRN